MPASSRALRSTPLTERVARLAADDALTSMVEEATRQAAVLPVLGDLGWDSANLREVVPEFAIGSGRVDYCLRDGERSLVLVEVKRAGTEMSDFEEQLLRYAFEEGAQLTLQQ